MREFGDRRAYGEAYEITAGMQQVSGQRNCWQKSGRSGYGYRKFYKYLVVISFFRMGQFVAALKSTENTRIPMIGTLLSLFLNLLLNYALIFGHFGMPRLGVIGAAAATLTARTAEFLFIIGYVFGRKSVTAAKFRTYFSFGMKQLKEYMKYGFFVILGECIYGIGTSVYNAVYKYTGTESQAALQIVNSLGNLAMVAAIGIGQSAGVVIGKQLGRNELDKAKRFCNIYLLFAMILSIGMAVLVLLAEPLCVSVFRIGGKTKEYILKMVLVLAFTMPFRGVNFTIVTGILRSGGDSNYCFLANFIGTWVVGIPLAFLGAAVLQLPVYFVYLMAGADEVSKLMLCLPRALRGRWIRSLSVSENHSD